MSTIASTVMRRVRTIQTLRSLFAHLLVVAGIFVVALFGIGHDVWVARVLENMPSVAHIRTFIGFFVGAFFTTEFMVQLYVVLALLATIALLKEVVLLVRTLIPVRGLLLFFA